MKSLYAPQCPECGAEDVEFYDVGIIRCLLCGEFFEEDVEPERKPDWDDEL